MPATYHQIIIHLNHETEEHHEKIVLKRSGPANVHVQLHERLDGVPVQCPILLTNTGLVGYIKTLIRMTAMDSVPPTSIQFSFPGFPIILVSPQQLADRRVENTILDAAEMVSDSWFADVYMPEDDESISSDSSDSSESTDPVLSD